MKLRALVRPAAFGVLLTGLLAAVPGTARAQGGLIDRVKQKVKDKAEADANTVKCAATDAACIKKAVDDGKNVKVVDAKGKPVSTADSTKALNAATGAASDTPAAADATAAPQGSGQAFGDGVAANYDFVPGDRVIFAEDFTRDNVGDFPRRLKLKSGNFEVVDWKGQRAVRATAYGQLIIPLPEVLPSRFTFEADYVGGEGWNMDVEFADSPDDHTEAHFSPLEGGLEGANVSSSSSVPDDARRPITHVAVMADGDYAKAYVNGVRVANVPNTTLLRGKVIIITVTADRDTPAYLTNIRIAAGGKPLYDALMANGRVATHGVLFDTGSDRIRGESKPTLDQIGAMLTAHPDLSLAIEGHTDNVGSAASNQALSERRAAAVRQMLITKYGIAATRLTSKGFGATKPAASNDTPEGRQENRRVELVKV